MDGRCLIRGIFAGIVLGAIVYQPDVLAQDDVQEPLIEQPSDVTHFHEEPGHIHDLINSVRGYVDPENAEIISVHQLACLIDHLDKSLYRRGQVAVKAPDVWGQNRMTKYRTEFEKQMQADLPNFAPILSAYLKRSDQAALTSATTVAAAVGPGATIPTAGIPGGSTPLVANANQLIGKLSDLMAPSDLQTLTLANANAPKGIGLEPTVVLDEKARYLNHLHELRRINAGDDSTDTPGYGLYLMRMPVSLLPGPESQVGKGASVTVEAKFEPTTDLLPVTFRNVVILDTTYQLKDILTQALHRTIDLTKVDPSKCPPPQVGRLTPSTSTPRSAPSGIAPHTALLTSTNGTSRAAISSTEILDVYGTSNLQKLFEEIGKDEKDWYRHDPSVVNWLLGALTTSHNFIRDEARRGDPWFQPAAVNALGELAFQRRYEDLRRERTRFFKELIIRRTHQAFPVKADGSEVDESDPCFHEKLSALDVLTFGLLIQSFYLDRTIKIDMEVMARRRGCTCGDPWALTLYDPDPDEEARTAFSAYVACKWPIHVFSLDPAVDQQNELDLFSARSELQLALAVAVSTGQVNFNNATTYARRLETDLATIALNRTAVGFGAGETTFGWRFYPRVQTPPTQSNPQRILGLLLTNGPTTEYDLRNRRIEPGVRECVALIVAPNFVPQIRLTSTSNWFDLTGKHAEQTTETTDMVRMARKLQTARCALNRICDTHAFPPNELELLSSRLDQLEALLPMRTHQVTLPFEGDLTASEIFESSSAALCPRLLTWYGEPPKQGVASSIFVVGTGFSVQDLKAIAGGLTVTDTDTDPMLMSRNVLHITIPATALPIATNPNLDGVQRLVFDVHVASPNGVSNHLLVEAAPADQPPPVVPQSAYSINPKTQELKLFYHFQKADGQFTPTFDSVDPSTPNIKILWTDPTGTAPKQIQVSLNLHYSKGGMITIPMGSDLRLMSWGDGSGVPTSAKNLVIVGADNNGLLHIRIFDAGGNRVTDTDETKLPSTQAGAITTLKQQLPGLLPPHKLTSAEMAQVIAEATSIVGQTLPMPGTIKLSGTNEGVYVIQGQDLDTIATQYVQKLDSLDNFSSANPLPPLTTDSIDITPVPGTGDGNVLDTQQVEMTNQLTITPTLNAAPTAGAGAAKKLAIPKPSAPGAADLAPAQAPAPPRPRASQRATNLAPLQGQGAGAAPRTALPLLAPTNATLPTLGQLTGAAPLNTAGVLPAVTNAAGVLPTVTNAAGVLPAVTNAAQQVTQSVPALMPPIFVTTSTPVVVAAAAPAAPPAHKARQSVLSRLLHRSQ